MDLDNSSGLEQQVAELRLRVQRLEEALTVVFKEAEARAAAERAAAPQAVQSVAAPAQTIPAAVAVPQPSPTVAAESGAAWVDSEVRPPMFGYAPAETTAEERSLESRIGSQWFNRVGILAVLIAAAWFLKLAVDNQWIGPLGRVAIGLLSGAALIAWSERFHKRGFATFSYSLKAVGSGILYLSLWAAFQLFHLIPAGAAFAAMIAITAFNAFLSWVEDAELLALYAVVGGLSTPLLVSAGGNHEVTLFSYLFLLDLAVLVLVALRPWSRLLFGAFLGTTTFVLGWWFEFYSNAQMARTAFFVACFFLVFALAPRLANVNAVADEAFSGWDSLALVVLPVANAALGFLAFYGMVEMRGAMWAAPWLATMFAVFYVAVLKLPVRGWLRPAPALLSALHLTVAVVFLTIAIPLKAEGRWITIGWLVEGAALLWAARRLHMALLRVLALLCLGIGLSALAFLNPAAAVTPLFNSRFGTYCVAIAAMGFTAWLAWQARHEGDAREQHEWQSLVAVAGLLANLLILVAVCFEIDSYWWSLRWHPGSGLYYEFRMYAQFTYSAWFMAFGAALLGVGFWRRAAFLRWQALVLLAVAIGKVFLVDMSALSQGYRIVSFLGLGALLLAVSFVYQKDWLSLRGAARAQDNGEGRDA